MFIYLYLCICVYIMQSFLGVNIYRVWMYMCMCVYIVSFVYIFTLTNYSHCSQNFRNNHSLSVHYLSQYHIIFMIWKFSAKYVGLCATRDGWRDDCRCLRTRTEKSLHVSWNNIKGRILLHFPFWVFISLLGINFMSKAWYMKEDI